MIKDTNASLSLTLYISLLSLFCIINMINNDDHDHDEDDAYSSFALYLTL